MKKLLLFLFLGCLSGFKVQAQHACGTDLAPAEPSVNPSQGQSQIPCFDEDWVQQECITLYIKVNVHLFLDDNCEGPLAGSDTHPLNTDMPDDLTATNAFNLAEEMINEANDFFQQLSDNPTGNNYNWHNTHHGIPDEGTPECIPIRFMLAGVHIHCNSDAQLITGWGFDESQFFVNNDSEINIMISNIDFPANNPNSDFNPTGYANSSQNYVVDNHFGAGLLIHELGHIFGLNHSFQFNDGIDDTWNTDWQWDVNCDGTQIVAGNTCWDHTVTFNGIDACDSDNFCNVHPCCVWTNQSNNIMTYSQWATNPDYAAVTAGQLEVMLHHIEESMCDFVVLPISTDCPPVNALIGTLPTVSGLTECPSCFYLNASVNEDFYKMEIIDESGNAVLNTGDITGEAVKYCIPSTDKYGNNQWPDGFTSGESYTIRITVSNQCGDVDIDELTFILPKPCGGNAEPAPDDPTINIKSLSPNPTRGDLKIEYDIKDKGILRIYGVHSNTGKEYGLIKTINHDFIEENLATTLNVQSWLNGINTLVFQYNDELHVKQIIKE